MSYRVGKTLLTLLVITMMIGLASCSKTEEKDPVTLTETPTLTPEADDESSEKTLIENAGGSEEKVYKVTYYTVDTKAKKLIQSVSAVKGGATLEPMKVLDLVSDALEDSSISVSFDGAYFDENGYCVIMFNDSIKDISLKNPDLETLILDACGQSILDNIDSPGVIVRIGEEAYVTDQYKFDINYVYMDM